MKKILLSALLFCSVLTYSQETEYVPNELLIQLKPGTNPSDFIKTSGYAEIGLRNQEQISKNMNIYLFTFENTPIHQESILKDIRGNQYVLNAQNNHIIEERETIPTDPNFTNQWHHKNTGQTGGTVNNDIDTPDAWDITTGGTTQFGDEIVVCILEGGGANMTHPDINDNIYVNPHEIAGNGIDDDNNGYIDDINGWNTGSNSDSHGTANHGTQVMGMIGAEAENGIGTVGVNHNVKMMLISGFGVTESGVIAAYDYPLTQRKLYNSSGGSNGAFVVVTNASWGIDGANPDNYPLWCNYYDTLGLHGILNAGATTNSNFNVDAGGDMPTACGSDYMISVTATNHNDARTFSGYGATTIDLGAPGEDVYLPSGTNGYGTTSGTSFATPCVAGGIALAYSSPCISFASLYAADPQAGADYIRTTLLNTVDIVPSLNGECVTGGRMNVNSMINEIMNTCSSSGCVTPYSLNNVMVSTDNYTINWGGTSDDYYVYTRLTGTTEWDSTLVVAANTYNYTGLAYCTSYEYKVASICGSELSGYSQIQTIQTDGCCTNPALAFNGNTDNSMDVSWGTTLVATSYNIRYSVAGTNSWTELAGVTSPLNIPSLEVCESYDIEIQTQCADSSAIYANGVLGETSGCGACKDFTYCEVNEGDSQYEYIDNFSFGAINNNSGDDNGNAAFEDLNAEFIIGTTYTATLTPGYTGFQYTDRMHVWIDYNQNGTFEASERVLNEESNGAVSAEVTIPATAVEGLTRVRVMLFGSNGEGDACQSGEFWGEVEDYCITIKSETSNVGIGENLLENIQLYPNPTEANFTLNGLNGSAEIIITNLQGKVIYTELVSNKSTFTLSNQSNGVYFVTVNQNTGNRTFRVVKK